MYANSIRVWIDGGARGAARLRPELSLAGDPGQRGIGGRGGRDGMGTGWRDRIGWVEIGGQGRTQDFRKGG